MDSYNELLERMKDKYRQLTGNAVEELSDMDIKLKILAGELYNSTVNLEFIKRQMFPATATGEFLDMHARDRGMSRKEAVKAVGEVRFEIPEAISGNIVIPKGTVVSTSSENAQSFVTVENGVIYSGNTGVSVECEAEHAGTAGNVGSEAVDAMVTHINGISAVSNYEAFSGGADREDDEKLRARVLDSYISVSDSTNKAYYTKLALSVDGVKSVNIIPKVRGTGTVDIYISGDGTKATAALVKKVQEIIQKQRELNVDIKVFAAELVNISPGAKISLKPGYSADEVKNNVRESVSRYIASLEVGESVYESHLGRAILNADGVRNYSYLSYYSSEYAIEPGEVAVYSGIFLEVAD